MEITFRQLWKDERLKFSNLNNFPYITLNDRNKFWIPDTFFSEEKAGYFHNIATNNLYLKIFPDGTILYSTRISLRLSCPMNLYNFPMDQQICTLRLASCK